MSQAPVAPAPSTWKPIPGARVALVLLLLINFFNYVDRQVLAAVEVKVAKELFDENAAFVKAKMGALNMAFMVTYMVVAPLFGWLGDRTSRWFLVGLGVILWSLASGASGLAGTFVVLFITRCFVGFGEGAYGPVAPTIISDLYPVEKRGAKLAWFYLAIPIGLACGYILGGQVAELTGSWRNAFFAVVPPGLLLGAWCFLMKEPPRGQSDHGVVVRKAKPRDYLMLFRTPSYVFNTLGMTCMTFAMGALGWWLPRYIHEYKDGGSLAHVNTVFGGLLVLAGMIATLLGGWLGDRLKPRLPGSYFLVSGVGLLIGFPMVIAVLYTPFPAAWVWVFAAVFCLFLNTGPTNAIIANVIHPSMRSLAYGLNIFIIHALGDAISPFVVGFIMDINHGDMNSGFFAVSLFFLLGGIFWLIGSRYLERDTALAPTRL